MKGTVSTKMWSMPSNTTKAANGRCGMAPTATGRTTSRTTNPACFDALALNTWQSVLKGHVNESFLGVFRSLTGLRLWIFWHSPADLLKNEVRICPKAKRGRCEACLQQRWKAGSHRVMTRPFAGACGKTNYWTSLVIEKVKVVSFVLEARLASPSASLTAEHDNTSRKGTHIASVPPAALERAVSLLQLLAHELVEVVEVVRLGKALCSARRRVRDLESEAQRLRNALHQQHVGTSCICACPTCESHANAVVRQMLDFVHQHYQLPMSLGEVATTLGMNASYLSSLFSRHTGITFHSYLSELRLARARELLSDPLKRVSEVACAVGYSSDDCFRHAFKAQTGLSPSEWRGARLPS